MNRTETFREIKNRGATHARISFSGGNDEGGADSLVLFNGKERIAELEQHHWGEETFMRDENGALVYEEYEYVPGRTTRRAKMRPLTPEEKFESDFAESLTKPIYDRYYTFAGEFYVSGTLVWDVQAQTVYFSDDSYEELPSQYPIGGEV